MIAPFTTTRREVRYLCATSNAPPSSLGWIAQSVRSWNNEEYFWQFVAAVNAISLWTARILQPFSAAWHQRVDLWMSSAPELSLGAPSPMGKHLRVVFPSSRTPATLRHGNVWHPKRTGTPLLLNAFIFCLTSERKRECCS